MIDCNCNQKILEFAKQNTNHKGYLEFYQKKISYAKFFKLVDYLSFNLLEYGIKKGDVVTLMLPNCPQFAMLVYALSNIGAVASLISPLLSEHQAEAIMKRTSSKLLFVSSITKYPFENVKKIRIDFGYFAGFLAKAVFASAKPDKSGVCFEKVFLKKNIGNMPIPNVDPKSTAFHLNSGGTTGEPKTVMLSQIAVNTVAFYIVNNLDENGYTLPTNANAIYILPMFYGYGLSVFHTLLTASFNQYMRAKFRPRDLIKDMEKNNVEVMFGVPIMYKRMLLTNRFNNSVLKHLKVCYSGGEKLSLSLQDEFNKAFPESIILEGYGMSEAVGPFVSQSKMYHKRGSCGRLFGPVKIETFDGDKQNPRDTDGEVCVCTASMMNGYYDDVENTKKVIFEHNGEKWLRTGDFGKVDNDGYVFLSSRIKNIIKRNGINIFPSQIESCILELDFIKDVVVFGYKDAQDVERIATAVVLKDNHPDNVENTIKSHVKLRLSILSTPEYILIKDRFELTQVGKINTKALRDEITNKIEKQIF